VLCFFANQVDSKILKAPNFALEETKHQKRNKQLRLVEKEMPTVKEQLGSFWKETKCTHWHNWFLENNYCITVRLLTLILPSSYFMECFLTREMAVLKKDYTVHNTNQFIRFCCVKASKDEQMPTDEDNQKVKGSWKRWQVLFFRFQTQENIGWCAHIYHMKTNQSVTNLSRTNWLSRAYKFMLLSL